MKRAEIRDRVVTVIKAECAVSEVNDQDELINDYGLDSLDSVELIMELEDEFDINIPDDDQRKLEHGTVGAVIDYIAQNAPEN